MPLSPEHKERSKQNILDSAIRLFTSKGFDNTSIDQIMNDAKMTRGAFYAHFSSKSDLYKKAILSAAKNNNLVNTKPDKLTDREWIQTLISKYLSNEHINLKQPPCALAFLVTDVAIREPDVRNTYTDIYKKMNEIIYSYASKYSSCDENKVLAATSILIGGVAIGRALNDSETTEKLLGACREAVKIILET